MIKPTDLTTLENFKAALNVNATADDAWIQQIVSRATGWVEQATNRKLVARRYDGSDGTDRTKVHPVTRVPDEDYFYFDGRAHCRDEGGRGLVYLPMYPIQPNAVLPFELAVLTGRTVSGETYDATQLLEFRDYVVDRNSGALRLLGGAFTEGVRNYRVKCAAGYALPLSGPQPPFVPDELEQLCIELATLIYKDKKNLQSETIGSWSRVFNSQKEDPFISGVLAAYSRPIV